MMVFLLLASALTLLTVGWLLRPLWHWPSPDEEPSNQHANAAISREQVAALGRDWAQGHLTDGEYHAAVDEVHLRLLDEAGICDIASTRDASTHQKRWPTAVAVVLGLPVVAVALYLWLGHPQALVSQGSPGVNEAQLVSMVASLEARLEAQPNNSAGWAMLARSYKVMGRFDDAARAFANVGEWLHTNPDLMVDYAELLALRAGNRMAGEPLRLVTLALALDPDHPSALMMAGAAAYQVADFDGAVNRWERLLSVVEPGSADAETTQTNLDDARAQAKAAASTPDALGVVKRR